MKRSKLIAIIIGSVLGLALIIGGFLFMQTFSRASSETPEGVTTTEVTDSSVKISWSTGNDTVGAVVRYGVSKTALTQVAPAETPQGKTHSAVLTALSPDTMYYFELFTSNDTKFDNAGIPWNFTTKSNKETTTETIGATDSDAPIATASPTIEAIPTEAAESRINTCKETNCAAIKAKLGKECSTQEYMKCIRSEQNPAPTTPTN